MAGKHVVQPGESPSQIATKYRFEDWAAIYNHADNADLRQKRKHPSAIFPGDVVAIPEIAQRVFVLETGKRHRIVIPRPRSKLNIVVKDGEGEPLAGKTFELRAPSLDTPIEGSTTGDGRVECKIPVKLTAAQLVIWDAGDKTGIRNVWDLDLGALFAPETDEGVRQRLTNLGYHAGQGEDAATDATGANGADDGSPPAADPLSLAVAAFQEDMGLEVTGVIDDDTRCKLIEAHGGT